jgi:hypothetical protein
MPPNKCLGYIKESLSWCGQGKDIPQCLNRSCQCQANLEMSYCYQSRNVLFGFGVQGWVWGRGKWKEPVGRLEFPPAPARAAASHFDWLPRVYR